MNDSFSLTEIATIVLTVFGFFFAMIRASSSSRQALRGPLASFGSGILSLGIAGMTSTFFYGLSQNAGGSRATREQVFVELLGVAWRPMMLSVVGLMFFVLAVRSIATSVDETPGGIHTPLAGLLLFGSFAGILGSAAYLTGFITHEDRTQPTLVMYYTNLISVGTVVVALVGGLYTTVAGSNLQAEEA